LVNEKSIRLKNKAKTVDPKSKLFINQEIW